MPALQDTALISDANLQGYWKLDQSEDTNTKLLLHFNGADAATSTIESSTGKAVTFVGNAQIDTAQKKFGSSSLLLDGTGDYLTLVDSADWAFGTGAFTIDCWVRLSTTTPTHQGIVSQYQDASNHWEFGTVNAIPVFYTAVGGSYTIALSSGYTLSANTWYHLALTRSGNTWRFFVNGTQQGGDLTETDTVPDMSSTLAIGRMALATTSADYFNGWIDELRIVKGTAKWTANFSVPTAPYSFQTDDYSPNGYHLTQANVTNITGQFDQAGSYNGTSSKMTGAVISPSTGSITLTCWAYIDVQTTNYPQIFIDGSTTASFNMSVYGTAYAAGDRQKVIFFAQNTTNTTYNSSATGQMNDGKWHFYAGRVNVATGKMALFLDGVLVGAEQTFTGTLKAPAGSLHIGTGDIPGSANQWYKGYIDDVAIFNRALTDEEVMGIYTAFKPKFIII